MLQYRHILFDLDHTLWDFEKNSDEALNELYDHYEKKFSDKFSSDRFVKKFKEVNASMWDLYNQNKIEKEFLRTQRFKIALTDLGLEEKEVPVAIGDEYLSVCPTKNHVIPNAFEILDYLENRYILHIITNGFDEVQDIKLTSSNLKKYFTEVITSEKVGFKKPSREMFDEAISLIAAQKNECIMIGDNIDTDIKGAINAGIDVVFFNPEKIPHTLEVTFEIYDLNDLKAIL